MRHCTMCGHEGPAEDFAKNGTSGRRGQCKPCAAKRSLAWYHANPERRRAYLLKRDFGLTVAEHDRLLAEQGGVCAICRRACSSGRALAVDHDHDSDAVRGLLCSNCNNGLGRFGDDPNRLFAAAMYIIGCRHKVDV